MSDDRIPSRVEAHESIETIYARVMETFPGTKHLIQPFLDEYEKTENQSLAGKTVGISHESVAKWKRNDDFMKLFTTAHLRAQKKNNDNLRASMLQRGINGNPHYLIRSGVIQRNEQGEPIVAYRDFETQLTIFLAKNRMPDEFKDKFEHEISGQLIVTIASEFIAIVRRNAPIDVANAIEKELETLSAKLVTT